MTSAGSPGSECRTATRPGLPVDVTCSLLQVTYFTKDELLASQHCAVTHQQCGFSYLLPLGFSASPRTQPHLEGSPAGGSNGRDTVRDLRSFKPQHTRPCNTPPRPATANTESSTARHLHVSTTAFMCLQKVKELVSEEVWFWSEVVERETQNTMLRFKSPPHRSTLRDLPDRKPFCQDTRLSPEWRDTELNTDVFCSHYEL